MEEHQTMIHFFNSLANSITAIRQSSRLACFGKLCEIKKASLMREKSHTQFNQSLEMAIVLSRINT